MARELPQREVKMGDALLAGHPSAIGLVLDAQVGAVLAAVYTERARLLFTCRAGRDVAPPGHGPRGDECPRYVVHPGRLLA